MTTSSSFDPTAITDFAAFDDDLITRAVNNQPLTGPIDPPDTATTVTAARVEEPIEEEYQSLDDIMAELATIELPAPARPKGVELEPIKVMPVPVSDTPPSIATMTTEEEDWDANITALVGMAEEPKDISGENENQDDYNRVLNLSQEIISFCIDYPDRIPPELWKRTSATTFLDLEGFVFQVIHNYHARHGLIPTRAVLREEVGRLYVPGQHGSSKDEQAHNIHKLLAIVDRRSDPREVPYIQDEMLRIVQPWIERQHKLRINAKVQALNKAVETFGCGIDHSDYITLVNSSLTELQTALAVDEGNEQDEFTWGELIEKYPEREPPIIDGLVREAQIANLVSSSKEGKSWMTYGLAFSVIAGKPWLGTFPTVQGKVLIVDNELSREELSHRTRKVATAMGVSVDIAKELLVVKSLKHKPQSLSALATYFNKIKPGSYKLIILDAMYKFMEDKTDENSNADIGRFYAMLGEYAAKTKAAILLVHHSTKGNQSEKKITDVGSGAGAQSRAADCHIIFREHEEDGAMVLDAKVRSFAPVEPVVVRFQWPLWEPDRNLDPSQLATTTRRQQKERDEQGINSLRAELEKLPADVWVSASELEKRTSMGYRRIEKLLYQMPEVEQKATREDGKGIRYRLGAVVRRRHCDGITTDDGTATVVPVASPKRATTTTGTDDGGTGFGLEGGIHD